jgi:hypothetical protein
MATENKGIVNPIVGGSEGTWGTILNDNNLIIDAAFGNVYLLNMGGATSVTLTQPQYINMGLAVSNAGSPGGTINIPNAVGGQWVIINETGHPLVVASLGGGPMPAVTIPVMSIFTVYCDGANVFTSGSGGSAGVASISGGTGISASSPTGAVTLTNTGVTSLIAGTNITLSGSTGAVTINSSGSGGGGTTTYAATFDNSGSGAASGTMFNGSAPETISYNTIGALADSSFTGSNQSLTTNGYQKLPGGLIIQWGTENGYTTGSSTATTSFPIAFPNACLNVTATGWGFGDASGQASATVNPVSIYAASGSVSTTGLTWIMQNLTNLNGFHWLAIGY